jgi:hypothetical protein
MNLFIFLFFFAFKVKLFLACPKMAHVFECENTKKTRLLYIVGNMKFKNKTYGLNLSVILWLQIELQLYKNLPTCFVFIFIM